MNLSNADQRLFKRLHWCYNWPRYLVLGTLFMTINTPSCAEWLVLLALVMIADFTDFPDSPTMPTGTFMMGIESICMPMHISFESARSVPW